MDATLSFGEYKPDLAGHAHKGLVEAENVVPLANGYGPVRGFVEFAPALPSEFKGGAAFITAAGTSRFIAGTASDLYTYGGTSWASVVTGLGGGRWNFCKFGDVAVCVNGATPQKITLSAGTGGALGGTPPDAAYCATVGDFVLLAGDPNDQTRVTWSGNGDAEQWTAGTQQSGSVPLYEGDAITGITGGEFGLVFQRNAINRFLFTGGESVWQRDVIGKNIGCIAPGSIAQAGRRVFFLSERGFMMTDGASEPVAIGSERIDSTFFSLYARTELDKMSAAVDPRRHIYVCAMPGNPGRLFVFNYEINRWAVWRLAIIGLYTGFTNSISVDSIVGKTDASTLKTDDSSFQGGQPLLLLAGLTSNIGTMTGDNLPVVLSLPFAEAGGGRDARVHGVRVVGDVTDGASVVLNHRRRLGDGSVSVAASTMRNSGHMPIRATGRYFAPSLRISEGSDWSYVQGLTLQHGFGGRR